MSEFHPYFTSDGSVGLYNIIYNDIYHSATGALSEAYEKFILPVNFDILLKKEQISVLDICYGIGYNTKSFLNFILNLKKNFKKYSKKNFGDTTYTAPIDTDNILMPEKAICIDTVDTDNIFNKISVTAIDNDKILSFLSPFIKTGTKNVKNNDLDFNYRAVDKFCGGKSEFRPKIDKLINFEIMSKLAEKYSEMHQNSDFISILNDKKYDKYFEGDLKAIFKILYSETSVRGSNRGYLSNLHNIYYRYLSKRYKKAVKRLKLSDFKFELKNEDARDFIKSDNGVYNLIFLDAFSPNKCPCLWSYEFFRELYKHLEADGMLLTYSTSASVRGAMVEAGFFIGNAVKYPRLMGEGAVVIEHGEIYNGGRGSKIIGTVAAKNKELIEHPLSEFDLGLLKTRAGIFYRDENLNGQNEAIIAVRNLEVKNSDRISTSQYIKSARNT